MKTLALLSGGLDSCVALAMAVEEKDNPVAALTVFYGQKHARELKSAEAVANHYNLKHHVVTFGSDFINNISHATALIGKDEAIPSERRLSEMTARVPRTYVPGRNTIMLALAQSIAEANGYDRIYCGFNAVDYSGYPDCRPHFVEAWNHLARYATKVGYIDNKPIELVAPIINFSKASVADMGIKLNAPLHLTWSCYTGGDQPCGTCDSCIIRANAFWAIGKEDPVGPYLVKPRESF